MNSTALINQILSFVKFDEKEINYIISHFEYTNFKRNENILDQGQISSYIHFIINGLTRTYYLKDGKEIITYLACDNGFISSYSSFINQSPSVEIIQCIETTEVLSISYSNMLKLYKDIPKWERIGRILAEQNLLCYTDRILQQHAIQAKEKYSNFIKSAPTKIVQRTPQLHIASFLGIAPESLSRIRKDIS